MIKKSMLAACLAVLALAALPALASATFPNPYLFDEGKKIENTEFTVSGGAGELNTASTFVKCESVTGSGVFTNEETGSVKFTFHGCKTVLNIPCTTAGEPSGTITTTTLGFHLKTVDHGGKQTPGVLITPGEGSTSHGRHFATFKCSFAGTVEVGGASEGDPAAGIIGTITSPAENTPSNTATIKFQSEKAGTQTHRVVTNDKKETTEYDLKSSFNGGATETSSEDAEGTITFAGGMKPEIRTTTE